MSSKPYILFESYPDFSGSSLELYHELIKRGYDTKYDLVWAVDKSTPADTRYHTVPFFHMANSEQSRILGNTAIIIDSNRYINKQSNNYRLHVRHGCSFKACLSYYSRIGTVDAILTTSDEMLRVDQQVWPSHLKNKFIITGLPSNDALFEPIDLYGTGLIQSLTGTTNKYKKIIGWLPTYRQHRHGAANLPKGHIFPFGLPTINSIEDYLMLNKILHDTNTLILVQMHHAQAANFHKLPIVSNIKFINEENKKKYSLTTQNLMAGFDALITDYSAAYHEYIILNRPICLTVDDLLEYNDAVGFCYNYLDWIKGEYALKKEHLFMFISHLINNLDVSIDIRTQSLHKIHKYIDNNSTNRVIDYLIRSKVL